MVSQRLRPKVLAALISMAFAHQAVAVNDATSPVFINEIHYDNSSTDVDEGFEIAGPAGTDLSTWQVALYNGSGGGVYETISLSGTIADQQNGYGTVWFPLPVNGLQNGPDALALVDSSSQVVQFLSYEGSFQATDGPAERLTSTDIGVSEIGTPVGESLQLSGSGTVNGNFTWQTSQAHTRGLVNVSQAFGIGAPIDQPVAAVCPMTVAVPSGQGSTAELAATDPDGLVNDAQITGGSFNGIALQNAMFASAEGQEATVDFVVDSSVANGFYPDVTVTFSSDDGQIANCTFDIVVGNNVRIHDIQGAGHISPMQGLQVVNVPGIVTAISDDYTLEGFFIQDTDPDSDPATSEALFVYTTNTGAVQVGDRVLISGRVDEYRYSSTDLTKTEISYPAITVLSTGNPLPAPVVLGKLGRAAPAGVIDDDTNGSVDNPAQTRFDPENDALDFYESIEGMLVQINDAVVVGAEKYGTIPVLPDNGWYSSGVRSARGGILLQKDYTNTDIVQVDDVIVAGEPDPTNVGDRIERIVGIMDYNYGAPKMLNSEAMTRVSGGLQQEVARDYSSSTGMLKIATYNVENLDGNDYSEAEADAAIIVNHLHSPDIVALEEIQDNNGGTNNGVVDASDTFNLLIDEIRAAGGPEYNFVQIDPVDNMDGGAPGSNIRVGFLYQPSRVTLVNETGGLSAAELSEAPNRVLPGPRLQYSPGRVLDTSHPVDSAENAFYDSRKPLAAQFTFNDGYADRTLFVIAAHLKSKGEDQADWGHLQPPYKETEVQRYAQAQTLASFVSQIRYYDPYANVILLGDLNDFQFADTLAPLKTPPMYNLIERLSTSERYTYVYEGNSQVLDHIYVTGGLVNITSFVDVVHVNAEFDSSNRASDHDPVLAGFTFASTNTGGGKPPRR